MASPYFRQMKTLTTIMLCYLQPLLRSGPWDLTPLLTAPSQPVQLAELLLVGPARDPDTTGEMDKVPSASAWVPSQQQPRLGTLSQLPKVGDFTKGCQVKAQSLLWHRNKMSPLPLHPRLQNGRGRLGKANRSPGKQKQVCPSLFVGHSCTAKPCLWFGRFAPGYMEKWSLLPCPSQGPLPPPMTVSPEQGRHSQTARGAVPGTFSPSSCAQGCEGAMSCPRAHPGLLVCTNCFPAQFTDPGSRQLPAPPRKRYSGLEQW